MEIIGKIMTGALNLLPDNPFTSAIAEVSETGTTWWGYVNYFVPVKAILAIATGWASCMVFYFAWLIICDVIGKVVGK